MLIGGQIAEYIESVEKERATRAVKTVNSVVTFYSVSNP
jgi:hypothetical protein